MISSPCFDLATRGLVSVISARRAAIQTEPLLSQTPSLCPSLESISVYIRSYPSDFETLRPELIARAADLVVQQEKIVGHFFRLVSIFTNVKTQNFDQL